MYSARPFVESHHQSAIDVKKEVVLAAAEGRSLAEIAEQSSVYAELFGEDALAVAETLERKKE